MSVIGIEANQGTMSRVLVMPIEGILRKEVGGQINPDGFYLYRTLLGMYRILLVTYETDRQRTESWLDKEGIFGYDDLLMPFSMAANWTTETYWSNVIRITRMRGYTVSLVVVNSPQDALEVIGTSTPVCLFAQPAYGLPEWLPGSRRGAEAWDDLVGKIEAEREVRARDKRMEEHVE